MQSLLQASQMRTWNVFGSYVLSASAVQSQSVKQLQVAMVSLGVIAEPYKCACLPRHACLWFCRGMVAKCHATVHPHSSRLLPARSCAVSAGSMTYYLVVGMWLELMEQVAFLTLASACEIALHAHVDAARGCTWHQACETNMDSAR